MVDRRVSKDSQVAEMAARVLQAIHSNPALSFSDLREQRNQIMSVASHAAPVQRTVGDGIPEGYEGFGMKTSDKATSTSYVHFCLPPAGDIGQPHVLLDDEATDADAARLLGALHVLLV